MEVKTIAADSAQWTVRRLIATGISQSLLLNGTDLDPDWPWKKNVVISFDQYRELIRRAYELTNDSALGLNLSREFSIAELGMMGYAIMSSSNLAEAIRIGVRFWELAGQLLKLRVDVDDRYWSFNMFPANPAIKGQSLIYAVEECLTSNFAAKSFLVNRPVFPERIDVTYPEPDYAELYKVRFQCDIQFNSKSNRYLFSADLVELPIVTSQPDIAEYCNRQCEQIFSQMTGTDRFVTQIRRLIFNCAERFPGIDQVSARLQISPRTLHRRLQERNTNFQSILDEVREEIAKGYLTGTHLTIDQISDLMGFSEPTSFRRSFKRWTGISPTMYREKRHW